MRLLLAALFMMTALGGCGFTPLYATDENGGGVRSMANINIADISGSADVDGFLQTAFERRASRTPSSAEYDLIVSTRASARRLAVQIDASVTRFNYNLSARYRLVHRGTGEAISGSASAVTSYNIVSSQYSTLFAENAAREKAAAALVDDIERDILLQLRDRDDDRKIQ